MFTLADVRRSFDPRALERGRYALDEGAVLHVLFHPGYFTGEVRGSRPEPYAVMLQLAQSKSGLWLTGTCTCPVGRNCKHAAAVALAALDHPREAQTLSVASAAAPREIPVLRLTAIDGLPVAELLAGFGSRDLLATFGLVPIGWPHSRRVDPRRVVLQFPYGDDVRWVSFVAGAVDDLRERGWRIEIDASFPYRPVTVGDVWNADVYDGDSARWFELELGIDVDGERVSLLPVLQDALSRIGLDFNADPAVVARHPSPLIGKIPNGAHVALDPQRVARVLATLASLLGDAGTGETRDRVRIAALRAGQLAELDGLVTQWIDAETVRSLFEELASFKDQRVHLPDTFHGELRPYQHEGVAWLQALGKRELGGILADDMGLGKTVQLLAHLAIERAEGRLEKPVLVVAPTSVVPNWRAEIARFVPQLKDRIVLTSYTMLWREIDRWSEREWSIVVLDEAQFIKNPRSRAAQATLRLHARQTLALSGTPVENHLEELWSIYAFAVPGLLPDATRFRKLFRVPIEKQGDDARRRALVARVAPFLLRRTKERVASELPTKTEIVQRIELSGAQRDLYETIRVAMYGRVREEIAKRGLGRSRIVVLDALLKLRQVCCDPRLLALPGVEISESQKLEALFEMLESLIEDGRRILLFSQFTSMLDLIKPELVARKMLFVELRGDTRDRETPVRRFQNHEVPLFLISLKAGGTGLNLTAADTVIHYDPWWNPAVERQATDRAHRIGQTQHVFVYKLIAEQTVEERILEMQERKAALAESLFAARADAKLDLTMTDVERLFA